MTPGIVRIGDTVHRPMTDGAPFRHALLELLEAKGFRNAPKFVGIDDRQREILTYIDGEIVRNGDDYSNASLAIVARIVRDLHDATAGSDLCAGSEAICHHDIAPWNTVMSEGVPVAFIDFDAAEPGDRLEDIGYMLWTFVNLGTDSNDARVFQRFDLMLEAYGLGDRSHLTDAILRQQHRVLLWRRHLADTAQDAERRAQSAQRITEIRRQIDWVKQHRNEIETTRPRGR